jgi:hypothetical protein
VVVFYHREALSSGTPLRSVPLIEGEEALY